MLEPFLLASPRRDRKLFRLDIRLADFALFFLGSPKPCISCAALFSEFSLFNFFGFLFRKSLFEKRLFFRPGDLPLFRLLLEFGETTFANVAMSLPALANFKGPVHCVTKATATIAARRGVESRLNASCQTHWVVNAA